MTMIMVNLSGPQIIQHVITTLVQAHMARIILNLSHIKMMKTHHLGEEEEIGST